MGGTIVLRIVCNGTRHGDGACSGIDFCVRLVESIGASSRFLAIKPRIRRGLWREVIEFGRR